MKLKDILLSYKTKNGLSHEAMARRIGVSRSTYYRWISESEVHLQAETAKRLSHVLGCERSLLEAPGGQIKPLLGTVKAGYDLFAQEQIEDMIEVSERDAKRGDYFLRVCGDSMEGAHIYDGDLIYVQTCDAVQSGQIAVVLQAGSADPGSEQPKGGSALFHAAGDRGTGRAHPWPGAVRTH